MDSVVQAIPQHILLDVNVPILDGLQTYEKIRSDDNYKDVPIRIAGYNTGGDDYYRQTI